MRQAARDTSIPFRTVLQDGRAVILANAGVLHSHHATVAGMEAATIEAQGVHYTKPGVAVDAHIVTVNGPKSSRQFGRCIAQLLAARAVAECAFKAGTLTMSGLGGTVHHHNGRQVSLRGVRAGAGPNTGSSCAGGARAIAGCARRSRS